ncbi:hypothetical protein D9758_000070 [Tetrapyrgos nigripes]|uniref:Uncharacterized protein n=1 Tax=Tetrapyrgos nigripes TaxID=182062 RepID=A0A8H5H1B4_9AGAR|nr:hypothetical protein D9758_000070 [Tetrapyrgos nigripes]
MDPSPSFRSSTVEILAEAPASRTTTILVTLQLAPSLKLHAIPTKLDSSKVPTSIGSLIPFNVFSTRLCRMSVCGYISSISILKKAVGGLGEELQMRGLREASEGR